MSDKFQLYSSSLRRRRINPYTDLINALIRTLYSSSNSQRAEEFVLRANGQAHSLLYRFHRGTQVEGRRSQSQAPHFHIDQMHAFAPATLPCMESHVDRNTDPAVVNHPVRGE